MKYLHTMIRVHDLDAALRFFVEGLGLRETRRMDNAQGRYTLVFLAADQTPDAEIELTVLQGAQTRTIRLRGVDRMQTLARPAGI